MQSADGVQDNIQKIAQLFPNCVTETVVGYHDDGSAIVKNKVDFEKLQQELSDAVISGREERYQFTWPDKRKAILAANAPVNATLRPCREESVNFDTTQNLYIEGDNLDVLKCLKETYLHKVKMIYIDPPYNTGNDFVYEDDFAESTAEYLANSGQFDEQGNRMVTNTESNGRFHTDWLNMIYPRLKVARDLLTEDGVIFISIDDRECDNLIKICDEIFGESCFVGNISWQKTYSPRNDSKGIPAEKESVVVYGKNPGWTPKKLPRTEEMDAKYKNPDNDVMPWTSDNPCAPGAKTHQGMVYAIQHPFTGEMLYPATSSCWRYEQNTMFDYMSGWCEYELKDLGDEAKRAQICGIAEDDVRKGVCAIVLKSSLEEAKAQATKVLKRGQWPRFYFTKNGMGGIRRKTYLEKVEGKMVTNLWPHSEVGHTDEAKKELKALFDGAIPFDTPKPVRLIQRMVQIATNEGDIVLDFFSGAATTAQAVILHNSIADDGGNRKFILVQLPEKVDNKWGNLCEIGKERIRRAGAKIKADSPLTTQDLDTGFRVLKLDSTNMEDIYYSPAATDQRNLFNMVDNVKPDRTSEDLLFQVMLELGAELNSSIRIKELTNEELGIRNEELSGMSELGMRNEELGRTYTIYNVADGYIVACFDQDVTDEVVTAIAKMQPMYAVLRDTSMKTDSTATNFEQLFKTFAPNCVCRII